MRLIGKCRGQRVAKPFCQAMGSAKADGRARGPRKCSSLPDKASADSEAPPDLAMIARPRAAQSGAKSAAPVEGPEVARPLRDDEVRELWLLLFGREADEDDMLRWLASEFKFAGGDQVEEDRERELMPCPWGLTQELGGPCGVFAAMQAFVLRELFWGAPLGADLDPISASPSEASTAVPTSDSDSDHSPAAPSARVARTQEGSLGAGGAAAPHTMQPSAGVIADALAARFRAAGPAELLAVASARMLYNAGGGRGAVWVQVESRTRMVRRSFPTWRSLVSWLAAERVLMRTRSPVMSLVCSLVCTRGVPAVRGDMDSASTPLIGLFGHCSQELTNLCVSGRAVANVFDGEVQFADGTDSIVLRGVDRPPEVGFLSTLEAFRLVQVGSHLKQPKYPLWVVGSATHYTLLFSDACGLNHVCEPCGGAAERLCPVCHRSLRDLGVDGQASVGRMWHINGRADVPCGAPALRVMEVGVSRPLPEYVPANLVGDEDDRVFVEMIRSRWPGAQLSLDPLGPQLPPSLN